MPQRSMIIGMVLISFLAMGCGERVDPYDPAKMDLKPVPAKVSGERHKGPFAAGASLSMGAELKPLDPAAVKDVRLDTTHKIIEIAPGVLFSAWTFGDQVPGRRCALASATGSGSS